MRKILRKVLRLIYNYLKQENNSIVPKFKHGKCFYSNTHIDSLFPQFVEIGDHFTSAPGSIIVAHDASTFLFSKKYRVEKVIIGNNVFLGANSVVLPGVIIGNNVIVGAGTIVTKSIPNNCVVAGNPATIICSVDDYINKCEKRGVFLRQHKNSLMNMKMK